jgi:hypothetical protein
MKKRNSFALCMDDAGYEVSLILAKAYKALPDQRAAEDDRVRIVDETGEDYLFHKDHFVFVDFPRAVKSKLLAIQKD